MASSTHKSIVAAVHQALVSVPTAGAQAIVTQLVDQSVKAMMTGGIGGGAITAGAHRSPSAWERIGVGLLVGGALALLGYTLGKSITSERVVLIVQRTAMGQWIEVEAA